MLCECFNVIKLFLKIFENVEKIYLINEHIIFKQTIIIKNTYTDSFVKN